MNKTIGSFFVCIILISIISASCGSSKHNAEQTNFDRIDSLRSHLLTIEDSLLYRWNIMLNDDNERIRSLAKLVKKLRSVDAIDSSQMASIQNELEELKKSRYFMTKMTSEEIDTFDSVSFALSRKIVQISDSVGLSEKDDWVNDLISSIHAKEGQILLCRIKYDNVAKEHNEFVEIHKDVIDDIDSELHHTVLPLFELPPEAAQ